jgi:hypothetical protein
LPFPRRIALTLAIEQEFHHVLAFTRMYHEKMKRCVPLAAVEVNTGAVQENRAGRRGGESPRFSRAASS